MAESQDKVSSALKIRQVEYNLKKLVVLSYCSDELLEDAALLEKTLREGFAEEISFRLEDSIVRGSGAGQCLGFLTSGCLVSQTRATASTIGVADITGMWSLLLPGSHSRAVWLINPDSLSTLYQLTLGTTGQTPMFIPGGGLSQSPYPTLLGRPLIITELADTLANANALMLVDLSYYGLVTRGLKIDSSMHVKFVQDEQTFRGVFRVDGSPLLSNSILPFKGANRLSAFVTLTA